jgi:hypothetical protein
MSLCWDIDCTMQLYQGVAMTSIWLSSIWMVGIRLRDSRPSVGHRIRGAEAYVGIRQCARLGMYTSCGVAPRLR